MDITLPVKTVSVSPLHKNTFAPFGDVIEAEGESITINQGRCQKYAHLTQVDTDATGHTAVHIFHTSKITVPYQLDLLERHPLGSQSFMPLEKQRFLVVVAPDKEGAPDLENLRCFITNGRQGVTYRTGIWHHPLLSLDTGESYMVVDRNGPGHNCDEIAMPKDVAYFVGGSHDE